MKFFEYFSILIFVLINFILSFVILGLSYLFATQQGNSEKLSPYECGFDPFEDARNTFDVKFFLVAILFLIFDLEVLFLFPWAVSLARLTYRGFWSMITFLFILTIGFVYEWVRGGLEWE